VYSDLSHLPQEQQASIAQDHAQEEVSKPFNLSSGPLIRVKLINLKKMNIFYSLLCTILSLMVGQWASSSKSSLTYIMLMSLGKEPTLPPLALQYADFSLWQRNWLQGDVLDQQLSYWKEQLSDIPDLLRTSLQINQDPKK
jgi:hypothetical protein